MITTIRLIGFLRHFIKCRRGNVAVVAAIAAMTLFTAVGAAVDYSGAQTARERLQDAIDTATLAAGRKHVDDNAIPRATLESEAQEAVESIMKSYSTVSNIQVAINVGPHAVTGTATAEFATSIMALAQIRTIDLSVTATASLGKGAKALAAINFGALSYTEIRADGSRHTTTSRGISPEGDPGVHTRDGRFPYQAGIFTLGAGGRAVSTHDPYDPAPRYTQMEVHWDSRLRNGRRGNAQLDGLHVLLPGRPYIYHDPFVAPWANGIGLQWDPRNWIADMVAYRFDYGASRSPGGVDISAYDTLEFHLSSQVPFDAVVTMSDIHGNSYEVLRFRFEGRHPFVGRRFKLSYAAASGAGVDLTAIRHIELAFTPDELPIVPLADIFLNMMPEAPQATLRVTSSANLALVD